MVSVATRPQIDVAGSLATVTFRQFNLDAYQLFLRCKTLPESQLAYDWHTDTYTLTTPARFAPMLGVTNVKTEAEWLPWSEHLFDYQKWVVEQALKARRFACWLDVGLGKSHVLAEWCRQVLHSAGGRILILQPLQIIPQMREIASEYFGLEIERLQDREHLAEWCRGETTGIGITNPEKLIPGILNEFRYLTGLVLDDVYMLKTGGGVIKWNLIKSAKGIPFKLTCTATPAPNEVMEYASQASFLEKLRSEGEILWTWFTRNKRGEWTIKPHGRKAFYQFLSSWSCYLRDPSRFGFHDILASLPTPIIHEYDVPITDAQRELMYGFLTRAGKGLFSDDRLGITERIKLSQLAKGFLYERGEQGRYALIESQKPATIASIVRSEIREGRQVLIWVSFNAEAELLQEQMSDISGLAVLDGSTPEDRRIQMIEGFRKGEIRALISKPVLLGHGMNFQFCTSLVYSGWTDSFEMMYQSIHRCVRYGQTKTVHIHIPFIRELELLTLENVRQKEVRFLSEVREAEDNYRLAMMERG